MKKIIDLNEATNLVAKLKKQGKIVVNVHGCFDLFHNGHLLFFKAAKKLGDILFVTLTPDKFISKGPGRPLFDQFSRQEFISNLEIVDYVMINDSADAISLLKSIKPNISARGIEYKDHSKDITGKIKLEEKALNSVGGKMVYLNTITNSSTNLINNNFNHLNNDQKFFRDSVKKVLKSDQIINFFDEIKNKSILVIGEPIIDEYAFCNTLGSSTKHNTISAQLYDSIKMEGGSLAIKNHLSNFVKKVDLLGIFGGQNIHLLGRKILKKFPKVIFSPNTLTPHKKKYISIGYPNPISMILSSDKIDTSSRLFSISEMPKFDWGGAKKKFNTKLKKIIKNYDFVIVSDFGHGLIDNESIKIIKSNANFLSVNSQTNSANFGFNNIQRYKNANLVCIDELEARLALQDRTSQIEIIIKNLAKKINCKNLLITRGSQGMISYFNKKINYAPALTNYVNDAVGAGDAVLTIASLLIYLKKSSDLTLLLSSIMGMIATKIVGNSRSINKDEIIKNATGFIN